MNNLIIPNQEAPTVDETITRGVSTVMNTEASVALQSENLKHKMRSAATTIVEKKVDTAVKRVTGENNEVSSELEEEGLSIFGYKPGKSIRPWQIRWASKYHGFLSAMWMFLAMFTFAPIVFIAKKIHTAGKVTWAGIMLGLVIYGLVLFVTIAVPLLKIAAAV